MKKLSVLIALMLCVTIGGVYATWSYAGTDDIADAFAEAKVTIADVELKGANGTYKIESNLVLTVDQANLLFRCCSRTAMTEPKRMVNMLRDSITPCTQVPWSNSGETV